jgi:hypothetical protein
MNRLWLYARLGLANAMMLVAVVLGGILGLTTLIFGYPTWPDSCEIGEYVKEYWFIVLIVSVVMFFAEWSNRERKES